MARIKTAYFRNVFTVEAFPDIFREWEREILANDNNKVNDVYAF